MPSKKTSSKKTPSPPKLIVGGEGFDVDAYNDIARSAKLIDVRLVESSFSINPEVVQDDASETQAAYSFGGDCGGSSLSASGLCIGVYDWWSEIRRGRKKPLKATCKYVVAYENLRGKDERHVEVFFRKIAKFASFPYFRVHVAMHVAAAGLTLPPLPSITDRID